MKRNCRAVLAFLMALCLTAAMLSVSAFAAEGMTVLSIKDMQGKFDVTPASAESGTDLFSSFKNIMPGDICAETIEVRNDTAEKKPLRLSLCSVSPVTDLSDGEQNQALMDLLDLINVRIWADDVLVSEAAASAALDDAIPLGVIPYDKSVRMRVELTVPVTVDNEQAENIGRIQWTFGTEDASESDGAQTGDILNIILWVVLCLDSLGGAAFALIHRRKHYQE